MKTHLIILILAFLGLSSCSKPNPTPCPQENVLYQLEGYFQRNPDSVLQILDTLNLEVLSEKERAHYCLLRICVYDYFSRYDHETDSLLQVAQDYFVGGKDKYFEANTCEALARVAFKQGKGDQYKLDWQLKAVECIEQCQHVDERFIHYWPKPITEREWLESYRYKLHLRLGMTYLNAGYEDEGFHHLKLADDYFAENQKYETRSTTAYMLGNAYLAREEYDSCQMYYRYGLEASEQIGNKELCAYYNLSMAMYYRYLHKNQQYATEEEDQQLLRQAIAECRKGLARYEGDRFLYMDGLYHEASRCYFLLRQYDSVVYFCEKEMEFLEQHHMKMEPHSVHAEIYQYLYQSYEALGDKDQALHYARLYWDMQAQLEDDSQEIEKVKNEYDKKQEIIQLQSEQLAKRARLYVLLALALATIVLILWMTYRYRKEKEIEALKFQETILGLQSELEQHSRHSKQALQQRVMAHYHSGEADALKHILEEFATDYPQALEKLQIAHPDLNETERNIVVLSFLRFRVKEEADLLGLSSHTVTKYRTNIRRKVGETPISDLI